MSGFMESPGVLGKGCLSTDEGGCLLELGRGSRCEAGGYLRLFRLEKGHWEQNLGGVKFLW